jgi:hypothetical protein
LFFEASQEEVLAMLLDPYANQYVTAGNDATVCLRRTSGGAGPLDLRVPGEGRVKRKCS